MIKSETQLSVETQALANEMLLVDTHAHIDFDDFSDDRTEVITRSKALGVKHIFVPAVTQQTWSKTIRVCQQHNCCELALGLHPVFIEQHQPQHLNQLDELIKQHSPIAVGEIGLDFYSEELLEYKEKQIAFFTKQLIIAKRHNLPVIIHNRKAHDECLKLLSEHQLKGGIIHAFNGSIQQAEKYIELGFLLGFGGMLTFDRSNKLRKLVEQIPIQSIVLETDSPDMTVCQHKGQRNSPEYIPYVLEAIANIKKLNQKEVAKITSNNALILIK